MNYARGLLLGIGSLVLGASTVHAQCTPTSPPAAWYGCEGDSPTANNCTEGIDRSYGVGGCYDLNGNCINESAYRTVEEIVECDLLDANAEPFRGYCTGKRYEYVGACTDI